MPKHAGRGRLKKRRLRRFFRLRTVRAFFVWAAFSAGQALAAPNGGSASSKLAEWARGHYLGPVVTFGEWLTYNPPKAGGTPSFSLAVPSGEAVASSSTTPKPGDAASARAFRPVIPAALASLAGRPLPGEGQWRVLEKARGEPAVSGTFLRDATYTSYVNGIVSMDQRLVSFQLHPGSEDPGGSGWGPGSQPWMPPGSRAGLLATQAARVTSSVAGVRQNLKLIVAGLLQRAGAVEGMQLDINPYWMSYEYYQAGGRPSDPTPVSLLPTQQQTAYRYYSPYSRDFTAAYAR